MLRMGHSDEITEVRALLVWGQEEELFTAE
jgi:hypothetical protein